MMAALATALLLAPMLASGSAAAGPSLILRVQQQTARPLNPAALRRIETEVRAIWNPYADIRMLPAGAAPVAAVDDALTLVVTDLRSGSADDRLGWIQFVGDEPSHVITVSQAEAEALAAQSRLGSERVVDLAPSVVRGFVERALARAVAHEVGHFLLRSKVHTRRGLMRAQLTATDLISPSHASFFLDPDDVQVVRARLRSATIARRASDDVATP